MTTTITLDERDAEILETRIASLDQNPGPRVGDYVFFTDGVIRRISHVWWDEDVQTSDSGSWYLGDGYCNFSGGLYPSIKAETLTEMDETMKGDCWFFHHDYWSAGNGVNVQAPFRAYSCSEVAPR